MDKAGFWSIIDKSREAAGGDPEQQLETLGELLGEMPPEEIVSFDFHLSAYHARAYHWDLWGAAYIIGGGCSDDGFMDFRGWLISRGEKIYEAAMADADSLANLVEDHDGDCQVEGYQYLASQAWEEKTGKSYDDFPEHGLPIAREVAGTPWEEEDLEARFPELSKRFD
ncbi:DUF4240 domain-containing protein [Pseudoduganella sp. HUAS MS19]